MSASPTTTPGCRRPTASRASRALRSRCRSSGRGPPGMSMRRRRGVRPISSCAMPAIRSPPARPRPGATRRASCCAAASGTSLEATVGGRLGPPGGPHPRRLRPRARRRRSSAPGRPSGSSPGAMARCASMPGCGATTTTLSAPKPACGPGWPGRSPTPGGCGRATARPSAPLRSPISTIPAFPIPTSSPRARRATSSQSSARADRGAPSWRCSRTISPT